MLAPNDCFFYSFLKRKNMEIAPFESFWCISLQSLLPKVHPCHSKQNTVILLESDYWTGVVSSIFGFSLFDLKITNLFYIHIHILDIFFMSPKFTKTSPWLKFLFAPNKCLHTYIYTMKIYCEEYIYRRFSIYIYTFPVKTSLTSLKSHVVSVVQVVEGQELRLGRSYRLCVDRSFEKMNRWEVVLSSSFFKTINKAQKYEL